MDSSYSLSDIAALQNDNGFGGGNGFFWIFALLLLPLLTGNGYGFSNGNAASQADIQRAVDLNSIQQGQADISADIQRTTYETMATIKDASYNNLSESRDIEAAISTGFANQQTCCCTTQRAIDGVNYNLATQSAAIQANDTANTQKILDAISANRIADLQNRLNTVEMQQAIGQATAGVVKYPMASTYSSGSNPFCGCSCSAI